MYKLIIKYYDMGLYTASDILFFLKSGQITQSEYETILSLTGDPELDDILTADDSEEELY